uniref:Uncharacterized protein n=2 Tax=Ditylum brightwellii TaxID=49249 RepID=A0A7S4W9J7_9STRA
MVAYSLGRIFFKGYVRSKLSDNEILSLVEKSMTSRPLRTSLTMKYSIFPEAIKNYGLSIMTPVKPWIFALATFIHGFPFTIVWTNLGWDSSMRLKVNEMAKRATATPEDDLIDAGSTMVSSPTTLPPNKLLGVAVVFVTVWGIVGSPAIMALWIRDLRKNHTNEKKKEEKRQN